MYLLLNINQLSFLRHELNLLLDIYPNNNEAIDIFNKYYDSLKEEIEKYERRYGPLCIDYNNQSDIFSWENTNWPWDN